MPLRYLTTIVASIAVGAASIIMPNTASAGGSCHPGEGVSEQRGTTVAMQNNCFVATVLRVEEGDTVTFHNKDEAVHSVTGVAWTWGDETPIAQGESVEHVFDENGVYVYTCLLHPGMAGAIIVGDGSGPGIGTTLVSGDTLQTSLGVGSPGVLPQGADPTSAAATSSGDGMDTLLVAGIVAAGVALLLALSGASMAMARASANRRAAR